MKSKLILIKMIMIYRRIFKKFRLIIIINKLRFMIKIKFKLMIIKFKLMNKMTIKMINKIIFKLMIIKFKFKMNKKLI